MRREELYIRDIIETAAELHRFTRGMSLAKFRENAVLKKAVLADLIAIGEAVAQISQELKDRHTDLPWSDIKAFRNVLVHGYFALDWEIIWEAVQHDVPALARQIRAILDFEFPPSGK